MIDTLEFYEELKKTLEPEAARSIAELLGKLYRELSNTVTKVEFERLREVVSDLAKSVEQLVEAQKRSEERLTRLELSIEELAKAQRRTEERLTAFEKSTEENFNRVWASINELAEAQKRTEQRVEELAEAQRETQKEVSRLDKALQELAQAQRRTEQRVEELAEAQKRTEEELRTLVSDHKRTRDILAGLSDLVGYSLEDKIFPYMEEFVRQEYGLEIVVLDRRNVVYPDGRFDEVNIYVEGRRNGEKVYLAGECKSRPGKKDIKRFSEMLKRLSGRLGGDVKGFIVGFYYSPEVEDYLREKHPEIKALKSFEFEMKYAKRT